MPTPKSNLITNKIHKLIKWPGFAAIYGNFFKKHIFENKKIKPYQSSKVFTPNERARKKNKKEPKIELNGGGMREN